MPVIPTKYRDTFARCAAPAAIDIKLRTAYRALAKAQAEVRWLEDLQIRRARQIEAGTWPDNPDVAEPTTETRR